jgi:hypothetical protein
LIFPEEITKENLDIVLDRLSKYKYTDYRSSFPMNCFLYAAYAIQWIHGRDPFDLSGLPRLPVDTPKSDPASCATAFKKLFGKGAIWPGSMLYNSFSDIRPGDILICSVNKVPGHIMISGSDQKIWHSNPSGVKTHDFSVIRKQNTTWHYRAKACSKLL